MIPIPFDSAWSPQINWATPAGQLLNELLAHLPRDREIEITVFGSAPLQLGLDATFQSGDVDIFGPEDFTPIIQQAGLSKTGERMYIEQTPPTVFIASHTWRERACTVRRGNVTFTFPHPIDILVAKIKRLVPKDLRAYHLVYDKTGHPTEAEMKVALQRVVDIYRPGFDEEEMQGDPHENTRTVWRELYGREIDVRAEIIRPALAERRSALGLDVPDYKAELRRLGE